MTLRRTGVSLLAALAAFLGPLVALGAPNGAIQDAIDDGLYYLASQQLVGGSWDDGDYYYDVAATGAALLAFTEAENPDGTRRFSIGSDVIIQNSGGTTTNFGDVLGDGFNYLLNQAQVYTISNEPAGNPDSDGNGVGLKFNNTASDHGRDTYLTGIVVAAFATSGAPTRIAGGNLAGRTDGSGAGGAWTYSDVARNVLDYFAYGQSDSGWAQGGWRYYADYNNSDNSTSQWPTLAYLYAKQSMGIPTPAFVKSELNVWVNYIQNPSDGGSYYDSNFASWGSNVSRTGALAAEMALIGDGLGSTRLQNALNYLNNQWPTGTTANAWNGNFGHPYAMFAAYKGLTATVGLFDTTEITNHYYASAPPMDPGDNWTWWEEYAEYLVNSQNANGSWNGYSSWTPKLSTAWYIDILNANPGFSAPTGIVPEPFSMAFMGTAFIGLVAVRRRRKARKG